MQKLVASRGRLVFCCCLILAGYFVYIAVSGTIRNHRLDQERQDAVSQVQSLEDNQAYLKAVKDYVASDAYVEQQARRQLGYVRSGEIPFVVTGPQLPQSATQNGEWWQRLFPR